MVGGVCVIEAVTVAAAWSLPSPTLILYAGIVIGGVFAWRQKRGDFYKALADEKKAENEQLRDERDRLHELTDITPIVDTLKELTEALNRHATVTDAVFAKVGEMNGSLRATTTAMEALGQRLVIDEAARALMKTAGERPESLD